MKKKEWKQRCSELQDEVIKVVAQARSWRKKYLSAIRTTGSLKRNILNKHIQCSNMADQVAELREAAEFEARVAARLATVPLLGCSKCPWNKINPKSSFECIHEYEMRFCRLREARLTVEEEMDGR